MHGTEPEAAVIAGPVHAEPALVADLPAKPRHLAACELQIVLGEFRPKFRGHVVAEEPSDLAEPRPLIIVEFVIHIGPFAAFRQAVSA